MENTHHTVHTRIMLLILAFVLLFASIAGYVISRRLQNPSGGDKTRVPTAQKVAPTLVPTLIPYPVNGSFILKEQSGAKSIALGSSFTIDLIATSNTESVAGYDVVISYDASVFERRSVQNRQDLFRIFTYERGSHLSISATKNLAATDIVQFSETPILSFTFVAKKKGTYTFSLKPIGNESSKLVNESAEVTYPETTDIRLEIN